MATGNAAATLPITGGAAAFYGAFPTGAAAGEVAFASATYGHHTIIGVSGLVSMSGAMSAYQPVFQAAVAGYVPLIGLVSVTAYPVGLAAAAIRFAGECLATSAKTAVAQGIVSLVGEALTKVGRVAVAAGPIKVTGKVLAPPFGKIAAAFSFIGACVATFKKPAAGVATGTVMLSGAAEATFLTAPPAPTDEAFTQYVYVTE